MWHNLYSLIVYRDDYETVIHADDAFAPVGYLNFKKLSLVDKSVRGFSLIVLKNEKKNQNDVHRYRCLSWF